ncbi:MAG: hypothetical protein DMG88_00360 [Acidobacteria bacterium]|nr:MAG: hypothetical protein DMG88_00360 [Acidobacteriota bacterium]
MGTATVDTKIPTRSGLWNPTFRTPRKVGHPSPPQLPTQAKTRLEWATSSGLLMKVIDTRRGYEEKPRV